MPPVGQPSGSPPSIAELTGRTRTSDALDGQPSGSSLPWRPSITGLWGRTRASEIQAIAEAAFNTALPESSGSLFESVPPGTVGGQGEVVQFQGQTYSIAQPPELRLTNPRMPNLQSSSVMPTEDRLAVLESKFADLHTDLIGIRNSLQNVLRAANAAGEESVQAHLKVDNLEYEWRAWCGSHDDDDPSDLQRAEEYRGASLLMSAEDSRSRGDHAEASGLVPDRLGTWWGVHPSQDMSRQSALAWRRDAAPSESRTLSHRTCRNAWPSAGDT